MNDRILGNTLLGLAVGGDINSAADATAAMNQSAHNRAGFLPKDGFKGAELRGITLRDEDGHMRDDYLVTLPEGWEIRGSGHPMHSGLFDAAGAKRAHIVRPNFWDMGRPSIRWECRYNLDDPGSPYHEVGPPLLTVSVVDSIGGVTVFVESAPNPLVGVRYGAGSDAASEDARRVFRRLEEKRAEWVRENLPMWDDPAAYWPEEKVEVSE
jgi:hypothetical protein